MVTKFEWMGGTLPQGLLAPTLEVAGGIDNKYSVRGRGVLACEICEIKVIEDVIETEDVVLLKVTRGRPADSMGVDTIVGDSARREGEGIVGRVEGDWDSVGNTEVVGNGDGSADAVISINTDDCATGSPKGGVDFLAPIPTLGREGGSVPSLWLQYHGYGHLGQLVPVRVVLLAHAVSYPLPCGAFVFVVSSPCQVLLGALLLLLLPLHSFVAVVLNNLG
ncbi:hypothetical protein EI94DRAFT_1706762 [Lactarius quietus]|nr:hypothetical protein EI94DRAFT_1706762 [Lactarius quietus]